MSGIFPIESAPLGLPDIETVENSGPLEGSCLFTSCTPDACVGSSIYSRVTSTVRNTNRQHTKTKIQNAKAIDCTMDCT